MVSLRLLYALVSFLLSCMCLRILSISFRFSNLLEYKFSKEFFFYLSLDFHGIYLPFLFWIVLIWAFSSLWGNLAKNSLVLFILSKNQVFVLLIFCVVVSVLLTCTLYNSFIPLVWGLKVFCFPRAIRHIISFFGGV